MHDGVRFLNNETVARVMGDIEAGRLFTGFVSNLLLIGVTFRFPLCFSKVGEVMAEWWIKIDDWVTKTECDDEFEVNLESLGTA